MPKKKPQKQKIFCNRCKRETNHELKGEHTYSDVEVDEEGAILWTEDQSYRFWICAGCEAATLEDFYTDSFMALSGKPDQYIPKYFPKRTAGDLPQKRFRKLPKTLRPIYRQSITAYNEGLDLLCAVGLRALIEGICADRGITKKGIYKKIDGLKEFLPENIVKNLHSFRFMGNDAVHDLTSPKREDLRLAIEISEDLLNFLYELDYKASRLSKTRQKTPKKAKQPTK
ncbi:DUF4145 domain-containing protein [Acidobacteria bacterium AH-259-D05]|nr:DUF4145 domain-containing protein [Acidobacteria bacterium AH-259-D05]